MNSGSGYSSADELVTAGGYGPIVALFRWRRWFFAAWFLSTQLPTCIWSVCSCI